MAPLAARAAAASPEFSKSAEQLSTMFFRGLIWFKRGSAGIIIGYIDVENLQFWRFSQLKLAKIESHSSDTIRQLVLGVLIPLVAVKGHN